MYTKRSLLNRLHILKSRERHWNGPQQQLVAALNGSRGLWQVRCCPKCLEEVASQTQRHRCGEVAITVVIKTPTKVPGGYVSQWD